MSLWLVVVVVITTAVAVVTVGAVVVVAIGAEAVKEWELLYDHCNCCFTSPKSCQVMVLQHTRQ